jgi:hypothetical protein
MRGRGLQYLIHIPQGPMDHAEHRLAFPWPANIPESYPGNSFNLQKWPDKLLKKPNLPGHRRVPVHRIQRRW